MIKKLIIPSPAFGTLPRGRELKAFNFCNLLYAKQTQAPPSLGGGGRRRERVLLIFISLPPSSELRSASPLEGEAVTCAKLACFTVSPSSGALMRVFITFKLISLKLFLYSYPISSNILLTASTFLLSTLCPPRGNKIKSFKIPFSLAIFANFLVPSNRVTESFFDCKI